MFFYVANAVKMACKNSDNMAVDLGPLLKINVPPPAISPVGITPTVTAGGKIATQTQGRGDGIFSSVLNAATLLYSTVKGPTIAAPTNQAAAAGSVVGTGNFVETSQAVQDSGGLDGKSLFFILGGVALAKLLKLF